MAGGEGDGGGGEGTVRITRTLEEERRIGVPAGGEGRRGLKKEKHGMEERNGRRDQSKLLA